MTHAYEVADELPNPGGMVRAEPIDWASAKQALLDHPDKWVKIVEKVSASTLQQLRKGGNVQFRGEELTHFQFAARKPRPAEGADPYPRNFTDIWGKYSA